MCDAYRIAPKRTKYRDTWFRSSLEARVAEALDRLGIAWEYETRGFRDPAFSGGQYTPDFWLPGLCVYIEVVGRIDERHLRNAQAFCRTQHTVDLEFWPEDEATYPRITEEHPAFVFVTSGGLLMDEDQRNVRAGYSSISVSRCGNCGTAFFFDDRGLWSCPYCGRGYGRHNAGNHSLLDYAEGIR